MLRIRLQRTGRKNLPAYRVVVADKDMPVKGKILEIVGLFLPTRDPKIFEYNEDRITHWVKHGALPTNTVARLLKKSGVKGMEKYMETYTKKRPKKEPPPEAAKPAPAPVAAAAPAAEAPSEPTVETPATETPKEEAPAAEAPAEAVVEAPVAEVPAEEKPAA